MEYTNLAIWIRGYLEALENSENISRKQIQDLIDKVKETIDYEEYNIDELL